MNEWVVMGDGLMSKGRGSMGYRNCANNLTKISYWVQLLFFISLLITHDSLLSYAGELDTSVGPTAANVIAYLISLQEPVDKSGSGEQLVKEYDCRACHKIGDIAQGGLEGPAWRDRFPDLTRVGGKIKPEWEKVWLKDPQKIRPGTYMPNFHLTDKEIDAIVKYLDSLK